MVKKIIISYFNNIAAILNNNIIEEIVVINHNYQVNDIYVGIVQKIFSSINAAFVKLGAHGKSGFIHISDIKPLKRDRYIHNITDILSINQLIIVQVIKEPTLNKGPRLTANIHLHGKYLVLMPFCNTISISQKIYDENERIYLYSLALLVKPEMMGLLVKSSARGITEKGILQDLDLLKKQWYFIEKTFILNSSPCLIYKDEDLIKKIIRDFYEENIKKIIIDSEDGLNKLYYYLKVSNKISSIFNTRLQLFKTSECILEKFNIKQVIKESLKPRVKLISGGYLIIENYEALTIIDVNSGSFNKSTNSKETILRINFYAAIEIAHQLKIRNINGVIIIDFIDMHSPRDQLQLLEHLNRLLKFDTSKPQIVQLSELGFVELTRRRRGQSLQEIFSEINIRYSQLNFDYQKSYNYFYSMLKLSTNNQLLIYKNIRSLFFNKRFTRRISVQYKKKLLNDNLYDKYFLFFDSSHLVIFFNTRANHIVPLVFYSYLINAL